MGNKSGMKRKNNITPATAKKNIRTVKKTPPLYGIKKDMHLYLMHFIKNISNSTRAAERTDSPCVF